MSDQEARPYLVIDAEQPQKQYFKDIFRSRELFYFFAWRDILVRYKQAFFGIAWALVRPLLTMVAFSLIFGNMANLPSDNVPYGLFVLAAMLPWQLFSYATLDTCSSLVNHSQLVSKTYFPRIIIPIAEILVHVVDFCITATLLIVLSLVMGSLSLWTLFAMPLFLIHAILLCAGLGLWLSALTVQYRDFRIIVPFLLQFALFASPIGYGTFVIPDRWHWLYFLNPLVGIIDGFRWAFFGIAHPYFLTSFLYSITITCILLISGFFYFRKMECTFADKI